MGFRNRLTTAAALDTGVSAAPGVRIYADRGNPASGVVKWNAGPYTASGTLTSSDTGSGGAFFGIGLDGHTQFQANREQQADGSYADVARVNATQTYLQGIPCAQAYQTVAQTLTTGVWTPITLGRTELNPFGLFGVGVGAASRIVAPAHGIYEFAAAIQFAANGTGRRGVRYNYAATSTGAAVIAPDSVDAFLPPSANVCAIPSKPFLVELQAGGWCEMQGFQDSGGNLATFLGSDSASSLSAKLVTSLP